jgi:peptidoglycan/xylan/chitin deacetylase (PgdA/CDA1 family)
MIKNLSDQGIEFAVHGYIHTDYKTVSAKEQDRHFQKAIDTFKAHRIPFVGFRAPFLRISHKTTEVLKNLGFHYDSSHSIYWDVIKQNGCSPHARREYDRLISFYQAQSSQDYLSLPRFINGLVEIPVSFPDDEAMVDRLSMKDAKEMTQIWLAILQQTYERGELFTIQLHPERISLCASALEDTLQEAKRLKPPIWIATLSEIAEWWREKNSFGLQVDAAGNGRYRVLADCSESATLLLKNCEPEAPVADRWSDGYQSVTAKDLTVRSSRRPVIGVARDSSPNATDFLRSEGFVVERSDQRENYGIYLNDLQHFQVTDEKALSEKIERSKAPLLRYWRWPYQTKSALAITGDIDSMTLSDFALRIFETWHQNGR